MILVFFGYFNDESFFTISQNLLHPIINDCDIFIAHSLSHQFQIIRIEHGYFPISVRFHWKFHLLRIPNLRLSTSRCPCPSPYHFCNHPWRWGWSDVGDQFQVQNYIQKAPMNTLLLPGFSSGEAKLECTLLCGSLSRLHERFRVQHITFSQVARGFPFGNNYFNQFIFFSF